MECGDASGTGVLDLPSRTFSAAACAHVDERMLSLLPPLVAADAAVGTVTEAAAKRFGVPTGIPISPGAVSSALHLRCLHSFIGIPTRLLGCHQNAALLARQAGCRRLCACDCSCC